MKKMMICINFCSIGGTIIFSGLFHILQNPVFLSLAITAGTIAYHFSMRLLVGFFINARFHNQMDDTRKWFSEKKFEKTLYEKIGVRHWKNKLPSFDPDTFMLNTHTLKEIVGATCQAETVHEIIIALSFLPLLAAGIFGSFWVFFITSAAAAGTDLLFVIVQRYNRPRIQKFYRRHYHGKEKTKKNGGYSVHPYSGHP